MKYKIGITKESFEKMYGSLKANKPHPNMYIHSNPIIEPDENTIRIDIK